MQQQVVAKLLYAREQMEHCNGLGFRPKSVKLAGRDIFRAESYLLDSEVDYPN